MSDDNGGAAPASTDSRRKSVGGDAASLARRFSLSQKLAKFGSKSDLDRKEQEEKMEANRLLRRRTSLQRMAVTPGVQSVLAEAAISADVDGSLLSPTKKLANILTLAKEKGVSAEKLFEYFAPEGQTVITPQAFEAALAQLGTASFSSSKKVIKELMDVFDANKNGTIEMSEFMEFCLSINSLAWKAEKARRLASSGEDDTLANAARNVERRRSSLKSIHLGKLLDTSCKFFWRSKINLDVAIHENTEERVVIVSTHSAELDHYYPPIFVDPCRLPVTRKDCIKALEKGEVEAKEMRNITQADREQLLADKREQLIVEYISNRLKLDELNFDRRSDDSNNFKNGMPYLAKYSTDSTDSPIIAGAYIIERPFAFKQRRVSTFKEFRRKSVELENMHTDIAELNDIAQCKISEAARYRELSSSGQEMK